MAGYLFGGGADQKGQRKEIEVEGFSDLMQARKYTRRCPTSRSAQLGGCGM